MHELYVMEGVDGTGKTSLGLGLATGLGGVYYKGLPKALKPFKEFIDTKAPALLRYYFYSLGNRIATREIKQLLKKTDVVVDQYVYCTAAFNSVSLKRSLELPVKHIQPRKIIYLTVDWDEIDRRLDSRGGRKQYEELNYLKEVDAAYRDIFKDFQNVLFFDNQHRSLDANLSLLIQKIRD